MIARQVRPLAPALCPGAQYVQPYERKGWRVKTLCQEEAELGLVLVDLVRTPELPPPRYSTLQTLDSELPQH